MKIKIEFKLDNACFISEEGWIIGNEIASTIEREVFPLLDDVTMPQSPEEFSINDSNGNKIGTYKITK